MLTFKKLLILLVMCAAVAQVHTFLFDDAEEFLQQNQDSGNILLEINVSGRVKRLLVHEGDVVKTGDELLELEIENIAEQFNRANVTYNQVKNQYRRILEKYKQKQAQKTELEQAVADVKTAEAKLQNVQNYMSSNILSAPLSGRVLKIRAKAGDEVEDGFVIMVLEGEVKK